MLGWIERVVPQPPVLHLTDKTPLAPLQDPELAKAPTRKAGGPGDAADCAHTKEMEKKVGFAVPEDPGSVFESMGSSVLSWLSQGLEKVIPQPVPAPGTLQVLGKSFETSIDVPDQTEVQILRDEGEDALEITPFDPEEDELDSCRPEPVSDTVMEEWAGVRVLSWLVQGFERMVPQPEMLKKPEPEPKEQKCEAVVGGTKGTKTQTKSKSSISATQSIPGAVERAVAEGQLEPAATLIPQSLAGDSSRMFAWFVQGLEKMMPQPVTREKQDVQGVATAASSLVEEIHIVPGEPEETDLVLKDIDDDQTDEAICEMMAWGSEAELVADAHPLSPIQEEPREEENRLWLCSLSAAEEEEKKEEEEVKESAGPWLWSPCLTADEGVDEVYFAEEALRFEQLEEAEISDLEGGFVQVEDETAEAAETDTEASDALSFA